MNKILLIIIIFITIALIGFYVFYKPKVSAETIQKLIDDCNKLDDSNAVNNLNAYKKLYDETKYQNLKDNFLTSPQYKEAKSKLDEIENLLKQIEVILPDTYGSYKQILDDKYSVLSNDKNDINDVINFFK